MPFFGLMTVRAHKAVIADKLGILRAELDNMDATIGRLRRQNARLLADLATLEAERERRLAPLIKANEMRREKAAQRKAGEVA